MKLDVRGRIHYPREVAYRTLRDELVAVSAYMLNVDRIEMSSRDETAPGTIDQISVWYGDVDVPAIARPVLGNRQIAWNDIAHWVEDDWRCDWKIEPTFLTDRVYCQGTNWYRATDDGMCELHIDGELRLNLERLPGVPSMVGRRAAPAIEKFVVGLLEPNLRRTADALQSYLDAADD